MATAFTLDDAQPLGFRVARLLGFRAVSFLGYCVERKLGFCVEWPDRAIQIIRLFDRILSLDRSCRSILAKEFALSDVALHKICKKHDIPNPPLGWWAKKAARKAVKQSTLPKAKAGTSDRITIAAGELRPEPELIATARENARLASLDRLRRLVANLRGEEISASTGRVVGFLELAERRLASREAALSADGLKQRFKKNKLFGDDDDHAFRPSYGHY